MKKTSHLNFANFANGRESFTLLRNTSEVKSLDGPKTSREHFRDSRADPRNPPVATRRSRNRNYCPKWTVKHQSDHCYLGAFLFFKPTPSPHPAWERSPAAFVPETPTSPGHAFALLQGMAGRRLLLGTPATRPTFHQDEPLPRPPLELHSGEDPTRKSGKNMVRKRSVWATDGPLQTFWSTRLDSTGPRAVRTRLESSVRHLGRNFRPVGPEV